MEDFLAKKIHKQVKDLFVWTSDQEVFKVSDYWKSFADEVQKGEVFKGDCDDFTLTCAELLFRNRVEKSRIRLALCEVETGSGHLICVVGNLALDNRQRAVVEWNNLPYKWIESMRMDEPGIWRKS